MDPGARAPSLGMVLARMIAEPLRAATDALERVAEKDLDGLLSNAQSSDELGSAWAPH